MGSIGTQETSLALKIRFITVQHLMEIFGTVYLPVKYEAMRLRQVLSNRATWRKLDLKYQ